MLRELEGEITVEWLKSANYFNDRPYSDEGFAMFATNCNENDLCKDDVIAACTGLDNELYAKLSRGLGE
jgi:phosphoglycerol transferase MdoB-like AlkP superfamily enzyme